MSVIFFSYIDGLFIFQCIPMICFYSKPKQKKYNNCKVMIAKRQFKIFLSLSFVSFSVCVCTVPPRHLLSLHHAVLRGHTLLSNVYLRIKFDRIHSHICCMVVNIQVQFGVHQILNFTTFWVVLCNLLNYIIQDLKKKLCPHNEPRFSYEDKIFSPDTLNASCSF